MISSNRSYCASVFSYLYYCIQIHLMPAFKNWGRGSYWLVIWIPIWDFFVVSYIKILMILSCLIDHFIEMEWLVVEENCILSPPDLPHEKSCLHAKILAHLFIKEFHTKDRLQRYSLIRSILIWDQSASRLLLPAGNQIGYVKLFPFRCSYDILWAPSKISYS